MPEPVIITVAAGGRTVLPDVAPGRYALGPLIRQPDPDRPDRVVDRFGYGWITSGDVPQAHRLAHAISTVDQLAAERGPLVPVVPAPPDDIDTLVYALTCAYHRAAVTALLAVSVVTTHLKRCHGHGHRLVAGRPQSWESEELPWIAHNLTVGIELMSTRVDTDAFVTITRVLRNWVQSDNQFVEVAENLAAVFGQVVDGRGGWGEVRDDVFDRADVDGRARRFLTSRSRWHPHTP
jgi:hypothetical protein